MPEVTICLAIFSKEVSTMRKSKAKKIQHLLTTHLLDNGTINLLLPDGVQLEIGIVKETKHGTEISDDYCFVKASRDGSSTLLDTFKSELEFEDRESTIICVDSDIDKTGRKVKRVEII